MSSSVEATVSATASNIVSAASSQPPVFKLVGILLAVGSGIFIGASFVLKKKGLLSSQKNSLTVGDDHNYLKSPMWWSGMILMVVGELFNLGAYAFTEAILVTPLGALSVVICAILSSIFLKERLTLFGKVGCFLCICGATIIALNGPSEQTTSTIPEFQALFLAPGFLAYASVVLLTSLGLIIFVAPKHGKTNMLVYISICSLVGGLSVACTQGLGSSILTSIRGDNQFHHWFMYFLMVFVVFTLLTEINYLNKALALFNTSMVTPTYYVMFTGCTLITSVILYQGFKASVVDIITVVMGFLVIVCGITLLQLSKIDPTEIKNKLDRRTTILLSAARSEIHRDGDQEKELNIEDPGIDTLRGGFGAIGSIHRAMSARRSMRREGRFDPTDVLRRRNMGSAEEETARDGVIRYQLSDRSILSPGLPTDAADKISLYSNPTSPTLPFQREQRNRSSSIQFATSDNVHLYNDNPSTSTSFHHQQERKKYDHMHGPRDPPLSADVTSNAFELPTPTNSSKMYIDPYVANNGYHNTNLNYNDTKEMKEQDDSITPTRSRFNLPNFPRNSSRDGTSHHRINHPRNSDDEEEGVRLVRNNDSDEEEGDYNGGSGLEAQESRDHVTGTYRHPKRYFANGVNDTDDLTAQASALPSRNPASAVARVLGSAGGEFLSNRSYKGLEPRYGLDAPAVVEDGRRIARKR